MLSEVQKCCTIYQFLFLLFPSCAATVPLRVHRQEPGRSDAFSAGVAGRSWDRRGAGVAVVSSCSLYARSWLYAVDWRYAGRWWLGLLAKIWIHLVAILLDVQLRWSEQEALRRWAARTSINKGPLSMASGAHGGSSKSLFLLIMEMRKRRDFVLLLDGGNASCRGALKLRLGA